LSWRPTAAPDVLRLRANLLATTRQFFTDRGVLEVETPLLAPGGITDPSIEPLVVLEGVSLEGPRYLQTSPEYAMKRLLAANPEPIYQIAKAFRDGEAGARHNPEFTLLEWYRPGFDHHRLMDEVAELVTALLPGRDVCKTGYRQLFIEELGIDPCIAKPSELQNLARDYIDPGDLEGDCDMWLDLLMSHVIEPRLADRGLCFIFDYPASQAALSNIVEVDDAQVGQRFELYVDGVELANGYCELLDATEQRRRFVSDNLRRKERGLPARPLDERLLSALEHGLPFCSGVALGMDRLLMLQAGVADIREVLAFAWERI